VCFSIYAAEELQHLPHIKKPQNEPKSGIDNYLPAFPFGAPRRRRSFGLPINKNILCFYLSEASFSIIILFLERDREIER